MQSTLSDEAFLAVVVGKLKPLIGGHVVAMSKSIYVEPSPELQYHLFEFNGDFAEMKELAYGSFKLEANRRRKAYVRGRINGLVSILITRYKQLEEYIQARHEEYEKTDPPSEVPPARQVTLSAIDELLRVNHQYQTDNTACERSIELMWGGANDSGMIIDILTLARIAFVHLQGANFLVHEKTYGQKSQ